MKEKHLIKTVTHAFMASQYEKKKQSEQVLNKLPRIWRKEGWHFAQVYQAKLTLVYLTRCGSVLQQVQVNQCQFCLVFIIKPENVLLSLAQLYLGPLFWQNCPLYLGRLLWQNPFAWSPIQTLYFHTPIRGLLHLQTVTLQNVIIAAYGNNIDAKCN